MTKLFGDSKRDYEQMTKEQLTARLLQMGDEYNKQTDQVEADNHLIADLQNRVFELETKLAELAKLIA